MRVWNASGIRQRGILRGHSEAVTRVMFSPSGRMLVSSSGDKTARVWDVEAERELITLGGHNDTVHTAIFSSDGARIVTVSEDKKI
jgi:WD40 repeat protein